jgi:hypothetical protein
MTLLLYLLRRWVSLIGLCCTSLERLDRDKRSSLLGPLLSYEDNEVLEIWPQHWLLTWQEILDRCSNPSLNMIRKPRLGYKIGCRLNQTLKLSLKVPTRSLKLDLNHY